MSFGLILPFMRPIEALLLDENVSEIIGNPDGSWWYERDGILHPAPVDFAAERLRTGLEVIANKLGKKLNGDSPILNVQLPDGSRLAAAIPPVVRPAPSLVIRKFTGRNFTIKDLIEKGTITAEAAEFLRQEIVAGMTILISGGTGSGKTTLLNVLAQFIPDDERIVTIEDVAELSIRKPNVLAAECQTDTYKTPVSFDELLRAALRWRPDRIIVGETRGEEARTLLDSFNTGHGGSLTTIHANSSRAALRRFANLAMRAHQQATYRDVQAEIAEAVNYVVQIRRFRHRRVVSEILRVTGYNEESQQFQTEFFYRAEPDKNGSNIPDPPQQMNLSLKSKGRELCH